MSTRLALLISVVLAVVAAVGVRAWIQNERVQQEAKYAKIPIMVAKLPIKKGQLLKEEFMARKWVAKGLVTADMIHADEWRRHVNMIIKQSIPRGETILKEYLTDPRSKEQMSQDPVQQGMRGVTVRGDQVVFVGYLIRPGSYVDIVGTFEVPIDKKGRVGPSGASKTKETVLLFEAVKVLAVDNVVDPVRTPGKSHGGSHYRSITLELKPEEGIRLINASEEGKIRMMLRSIPDASKKALKTGESYRWDDDKAK